MPSTPQRRLAAIVFTDLVDFSLLSGKDENKALEVIQKQKEIVTPLLKEFKGTLHKETGDGLVLTFQTVTDAVKFSINLQKATKDLPDLNLRIGIHEGEITFKDNDILGDDVNITSRIEPFAAQGGIAISGKVQQNLLSLPEFETKYIGKPKLKGISQTIEVYCITSQGLPETNISEVSAKLEKEKSNYNIFTLTGGLLTVIGAAFWISISFFDVLHSDENKETIPSIGVLLMENKGDVENIFWSEMLTEELVLKFSKAGMIRVNPIYKLLDIDSTQTVRELTEKMNIRYILSSTLYENKNDFNLFCNLIDTYNGETIYSNKWTESKENSSKIVGNIAVNILKSINIKPNLAVQTISTENSLAYEYYLKAKYNFKNKIQWPHTATHEDIDIVKNLLIKAIEIDKNLVLAKIMLTDLNIFEYGKNNDTEGFSEIQILSKNKSYFSEIHDSLISNFNRAKKLDDYESVGAALVLLGEFHSEAWELNLEHSYSRQFGGDTCIYCINVLGSDKTLSYYNKALTVFEKNGDLHGMSSVLNNIGLHYEINIQDYETAINYFIESVELSTKIGNLNDLENTMYGLIDLEHMKGNYSKLLEFYHKVNKFYKKYVNLDLTKRSGAFIGTWFNYIQLHHIYFHKGDYENALLYIKECENYLNTRLQILIDREGTEEEIKITKGLLENAYLLQASVYLYNKEYVHALKYYKNSLPETDEESKKPFHQSRTNREDFANLFIGITYFKNNDFNNAQKYFNKVITAIINREDMGLSYKHADKIKVLAMSWLAIVDINNKKLIDMNRIEEIKKITDKYNNVPVIDSWTTAFGINIRGSGNNSYSMVNYNLYKIFKELGNIDTALEYLDISFNIIKEKLDKYEYPEAKHSFINNNPFHKEIVEEYNKIFKNK